MAITSITARFPARNGTSPVRATGLKDGWDDPRSRLISPPQAEKTYFSRTGQCCLNAKEICSKHCFGTVGQSCVCVSLKRENCYFVRPSMKTGARKNMFRIYIKYNMIGPTHCFMLLFCFFFQFLAICFCWEQRPREPNMMYALIIKRSNWQPPIYRWCSHWNLQIYRGIPIEKNWFPEGTALGSTLGEGYFRYFPHWPWLKK
jgi:hypothetical protein